MKYLSTHYFLLSFRSCHFQKKFIQVKNSWVGCWSITARNDFFTVKIPEIIAMNVVYYSIIILR